MQSPRCWGHLPSPVCNCNSDVPCVSILLKIVTMFCFRCPGRILCRRQEEAWRTLRTSRATINWIITKWRTCSFVSRTSSLISRKVIHFFTHLFKVVTWNKGLRVDAVAVATKLSIGHNAQWFTFERETERLIAHQYIENTVNSSPRQYVLGKPWRLKMASA